MNITRVNQQSECNNTTPGAEIGSYTVHWFKETDSDLAALQL